MPGPPPLAFVVSYCLCYVTKARFSKDLEIKPLHYDFCGNYMKINNVTIVVRVRAWVLVVLTR